MSSPSLCESATDPPLGGLQGVTTHYAHCSRPGPLGPRPGRRLGPAALRAAAGHRHRRHAQDLRRDPGRRRSVPAAAVPHDRSPERRARRAHLRAVRLFPQTARWRTRRRDAGAHHDPVVPVRRPLLRDSRHRRHVRRRAVEHPHCERGALEPQQGAADRAAGRRGERVVRGRHEPVRRRPALHRARGAALRADQDSSHDRGLRIRRIVRGPVRAAGWRHLHEGRRRRRRPGRQGRGGDPGGRPAQPAAWWHFALCGVIGIVTSIAFVYITQYYTEYRYRPVKSIAAASVTGPATNIIAGFAVALECTALPTFTISATIIASYKLGASSGLAHSGLFGTAVATMGMLGTAAYILAMDTFGPITDNAGGIIEMSHQPEDIRRRTDRLDAVGNTTKA